MTRRSPKGIGLVEWLLVALAAAGFWVAEGTLANAPTFSDCLGTIYVLQ